MANISVFGMGYIGVATAACLAFDGHQVTVVDADPDRVAALNAGVTPLADAQLGALIAQVVREGRLTATDDAQQAIDTTSMSFVATAKPEMAAQAGVERACHRIGTALAAKDGYHTVLLRTSLVPEATAARCMPLLEAASGKTCGQDFGINELLPDLTGPAAATRDTAALLLEVFPREMLARLDAAAQLRPVPELAEFAAEFEAAAFALTEETPPETPSSASLAPSAVTAQTEEPRDEKFAPRFPCRKDISHRRPGVAALPRGRQDDPRHGGTGHVMRPLGASNICVWHNRAAARSVPPAPTAARHAS
ncbi:hypothetical protein [Marinovum sp.]|uniref:hypothetical protein n=1 Tax=Marinovum sp. TaxID=2024839 RepID=UPI002B26EEA5|nr:hypothetical protein [Marinovum sp.]